MWVCGCVSVGRGWQLEHLSPSLLPHHILCMQCQTPGTRHLFGTSGAGVTRPGASRCPWGAGTCCVPVGYPGGAETSGQKAAPGRCSTSRVLGALCSFENGRNKPCIEKQWGTDAQVLAVFLAWLCRRAPVSSCYKHHQTSRGGLAWFACCLSTGGHPAFCRASLLAHPACHSCHRACVVFPPTAAN